MTTQFTMLPDEQTIEQIEEHFASLLFQDDQLSAQLLKALEQHAPLLGDVLIQPLNEQTRNKLLTALISVMQSLRQPMVLREYFQVLAEQYLAGKPMAAVCEQFSMSWFAALSAVSDTLPSEVIAAWQITLNYLKEVMLSVTSVRSSASETAGSEPDLEPESVSAVTFSSTLNATAELMAALDKTLFQNKLLAFNLTLEANRPDLSDPRLQHLATELRQSTQQSMQLLQQLRDALI